MTVAWLISLTDGMFIISDSGYYGKLSSNWSFVRRLCISDHMTKSKGQRTNLPLHIWPLEATIAITVTI
ncbi:MAG TPA: hypothetical protein IGS52_15605 [Oscillatoriaceae cyanobacterium M33_DOE_052]|uniref:Uncharacterized protein n=1 Tax=Planktothricoides sp. SpSt-374 TaxID=2282167 RepID=A0A7C3ZJR9_9CYAN|nr:hypothetical protein [Oscillatoriaceae cyanobacterium M33_DOE_052]